jgi:uncharacterized protein YlxW (UPF0749 family)
MGSEEAGKKQWLWPVSAVCVALGALLALQFSSAKSIPEVGRGRRADVLAQMLALSQEKMREQETEIARLRNEEAHFSEAAAKGRQFSWLLYDELERLRAASGLKPVKGPGVIIHLDDSKLREEAAEDAELFLIHDYDLLPVVNELRAAGAEAISINDQRVVERTAIRCVGPVVLVNNVSLSAPYIIKAIGDPNTLAGAVNIKEGVLDRLRSLRFPVRLEMAETMVIKQVSVAPPMKYAKPLKGSGPQ